MQALEHAADPRHPVLHVDQRLSGEIAAALVKEAALGGKEQEYVGGLLVVGEGSLHAVDEVLELDLPAAALPGLASLRLVVIQSVLWKRWLSVAEIV